VVLILQKHFAPKPTKKRVALLGFAQNATVNHKHGETILLHAQNANYQMQHGDKNKP
jgi:hypothetical protein